MVFNTTFNIYFGFIGGRNPSTQKKTTNLLQVTDKLSHNVISSIHRHDDRH